MLEEHVMRHKGIKNFTCTICDARKTTARELRDHLKRHVETIEKASCELCGMIFSQANNMRRHMKVVHQGVKTFMCTHLDCNRSFARGEALRRHIMTHTGERPFQCKIQVLGKKCDKRFIQAYALKKHIETHNAKG